MKTFAESRPMLYGAPTAAVLGVILGLAMRVGGQVDQTPPPEPVARVASENSAVPISWPSGKVPDYVIGTDFTADTPRADPIVADIGDYEPASADVPAAAPKPPETVIATRATRDPTQWASTRGDILDVSLPEDAAPNPVAQN